MDTILELWRKVHRDADVLIFTSLMTTMNKQDQEICFIIMP